MNYINHRCEELMGAFRCELHKGHEGRCRFDSPVHADADNHHEAPDDGQRVQRSIGDLLEELNRLVYGDNYEKLYQPRYGLVKMDFENWVRPKRGGVLSGWDVLSGTYSDPRDQSRWEAFQVGWKRCHLRSGAAASQEAESAAPRKDKP